MSERDLFGNIIQPRGKRARREDYEAFVDKFKPKKTTDDCYTPPIVFDAVLAWVKDNCDWRQGDELLRPFKPGGDYLAEEYKENTVVVDNPPFSIFSKIVADYTRMGVRFFLFAPHLTLFSAAVLYGTAIVCDVNIIYANGANVNTDFITNMLPADIVVTTAPTLARAVAEAVKEYRKTVKYQPPRFTYPDELVTSARLGGPTAKCVTFSLRRDEAVRVAALDVQRQYGKAIYGGGLLISKEKAAELKAAELKARKEAIVWELSDREKAIVDGLGKHKV